MTEFADLAAWRLKLSALDPPLVLVGRCRSCRWLRRLYEFTGHAEHACAHESEAHPLHWCQPVHNADWFGCTAWERKP